MGGGRARVSAHDQRQSLIRRRITKNPSKPTIAIVAAGIGVVLAASSAAAATWSSGSPAKASTTADYVSAASGRAATVNTGRIPRQLQQFRFQAAWHAQLTAAAKARRAAARAAARKAARKAAAHRAALLAVQRQSAQTTAQPKVPAPPPAQPSGSPQHIAMSMLGSFGWSSGQFSCLDPLWSRESGWSVTASNPDGAYGIPQAMPGSKMSSAGPDWETNATTQIRWGLEYIKSLYGSPCGAWSHEEADGWY